VDAPTFGTLATQQGSSFEFLAASQQPVQQSPQFSFGGQNPMPVFGNTYQSNPPSFSSPQFSQRRQ